MPATVGDKKIDTAQMTHQQIDDLVLPVLQQTLAQLCQASEDQSAVYSRKTHAGIEIARRLFGDEAAVRMEQMIHDLGSGARTITLVAHH